ncbi:MAG: T9SS type A sorting domain-containing protein [Bacteroidota bacterium]
MKIIISTFILLNFTFCFCNAQAPQKIWDSFFDGNLIGKDVSNSVITNSAGDVFVTGSSFHTFNGGNFTTIKYNAGGTEQWSDHYSNTQALYNNYGVKLIIDKWQNIYAVGTTALHQGDLAVCKYNSAGRIWAKNYEPYSYTTYDDYGVDIAVDSVGNFYANAKVLSPTGNLYDMYIIKCDSAGNKIISENFSSSSDDDIPTAISVTPNGSMFALCNSFNFFGTTSNDIFTINYLNNFYHNWESKYNGFGNDTDYGTCLKADNSNNTFVCGTTDAGNNNDMVVYKQNQYGTRLWVTTYNGTANLNDTAISTMWLPNGFVVVTGKCKETINNITKDAFVTMVIDSGTIVWTKKFFGADSLGAIPTQMTADAQGNIYICGYEILTGGTTNGCIIKYDSNGNQLWNITYDAGINLDDKFNSITLDNSNDILVTGQTFTSATNSNYVTVKFANTATAIKENTSLGISNITAYPNPFSQLTTINFTVDQTSTVIVSIYDLTGKIISQTKEQTYSKGNNQLFIPRNNLKNGIYIAEIKTNNAAQKVKLIVQ